MRKRAAQRRRTGHSFEQLLLTGDTAAAACAEYLAGGPAQARAGGHGSSGDAAQDAAGLLPDTPPNPASQPRLLVSCQSTRVLLSPRSRDNMSSDAAAAHAGGNRPGDSNGLGAAPLPSAAAAAPLGAVVPPASAPAAALQAQQLAQEIEMQLARQAQQTQQAQHRAQDLEMQLVQQAQQLGREMQLALEAQAVWHAQQAQQAQQAQVALQMQQAEALQAQPSLMAQQAQQAHQASWVSGCRFASLFAPRALVPSCILASAEQSSFMAVPHHP